MNDWDFSYDGVDFGGDTVFDVIEVDGLEDLPGIESADSSRMAVDGLWAGYDFARGRTITITFEVNEVDDESTADSLRDLRAAFTLRRTDLPALKYQLGGDVEKRIYCRPRNRAMPLDLSRVYHGARMVVQLVASDPRIYGGSLFSGAASLVTGGPGITFDATPDFGFGGAAVGGAISARNRGDWPAPWTATIDGPAVNPKVTLASTGQQLSLTGTVAEGDVLTLDSDARTILLNGASRYEWLDVGAEWFDLAPDTNDVQFGADSGTGTLKLSWRSTWL